MATGHISPSSVYGKRGHAAELARQRAAESDKRARSRIILDPTDVAGGYDAGRLLYTTLGGVPRVIGPDDLRAFAESARKLGRRYKGGITARGVIDLSRQIDRDRANAQIRTAVVVKAQAGTLHFVTNAGPESSFSRHHVNVAFPTFSAYTATARKPAILAREMLNGPLKFECSCPRFRYFYRFIATKGNFVVGRLESGFPKVTNPTLVGVGCKHALRVMQAVLKDPTVRTRAAAMIEAAQKNDLKAQTTTAAEAKAIAAKQLAESHHKKNIAEAGTDRAKRIGQTAQARARVLFAANKEAARRLAAQRDAGRKSVEDAFQKLQKVPLTKAMRDALIAKLMSAKTID